MFLLTFKIDFFITPVCNYLRKKVKAFNRRKIVIIFLIVDILKMLIKVSVGKNCQNSEM